MDHFGRTLLTFLRIWAGLFLLLCVVSITKNWDTVMAVLSSAVSTIFYYLFIILIVIYGIVLMIRAMFR